MLPKYEFKTLSVSFFGDIETQCCAAQNSTAWYTPKYANMFNNLNSCGFKSCNAVSIAIVEKTNYIS